MKPLIVLLAVFIVTIIALRLRNRTIDYQFAGRVAMMMMLFFTAIGHFIFMEGMKAMLPDFVPAKNFIVITTGVLEILFGVSLLIPSISKRTGRLLMLFFVAILPANIYAAIHSINYQTGEFDEPGIDYLWLRIPMQILFIGWVYFSAVKMRTEKT